MTELTGTLDGVGMPALVRFLWGLRKTGCLSIVQDDWQGDLTFEAGRLTDASFASRSGLAALDAVVQVLPHGSFTFDASARASSPGTIALSSEGLQAHLGELAARMAEDAHSLPSMRAVPTLVAQESGSADEPLPLDRATLQTLLAVDDQRTVREIVAQRGTFEALWQLGNLAQVGLIRLGPSTAAPGTQAASPTPAPAAHEARAHAPAEAAVEQPPGLGQGMSEADEVAAPGLCPKLGFEDDPGNSASQPTRLHRCFAAETPLPLSLDQQRQLCLSDHFATCPRLDTAARGATARADATAVDDEASSRRIVRLPTSGRNTFWPRRAGGGSQAEASAEPSQMLAPGETSSPTPLRARIQRARSAAAPADAGVEPAPPLPHAGSAATAREPRSSQPASPARLHGNSAPDRRGEPSVSGPRENSMPVGLDESTVVHGMSETAAREGLADSAAAAQPAATTAQGSRGDASAPGRLGGSSALARALQGSAGGGLPEHLALARLNAGSTPARGGERSVLGRFPVPLVPLLAAAALLLIVLAVVAYVLAPQLSSLLFNDNADLSGLPNASAVAAGTPVTQVSPRRTAVPTPDTDATGGTAASAPVPSGAAAVASVQPETGAEAAVPQPAAPPMAPGTLFDDTFVSNAHRWPSDPQGTAWLTGGSYRLITRRAGQFVAVGVPTAALPPDVMVSATFRKLDGAPPGGGFGIIVRDQSAVARDGTSQSGQYYVLEVGDSGEVGIWRRDNDHWVDLLAWQHTDAVRTGTAANQMTVTAVGPRLSLSVNGIQLVTRTDASLTGGGVGLLVGGDGNQVAVERLTIQNP